MTSGEEKIYEAITGLRDSVITYKTITDNLVKRIDSHGSEIDTLIADKNRMEGAISFFKWVAGSGGILGILAFIYQLIKIISK